MIDEPNYKIDFTKISASELIEAINARENLTISQNNIGGYTADQRKTIQAMTSISDQLINSIIEYGKPLRSDSEHDKRYELFKAKYPNNLKGTRDFLRKFFIEHTESIKLASGIEHTEITVCVAPPIYLEFDECGEQVQ